ncbi:late embryogenesis abundant protein 46-like [Corylus avellana]|uniref:late embryogenesis abundant protein 46-like n=1 Tax=Corylus avellana TaxID=13451 RepID=UPI001E215FEC|nr:late embryogenesis abundant protein 46-like [Corylus avellana]
MDAGKETAANLTASANAGMAKTKATVDEKMELMKAKDPAQKEAVTKKKEERITQANNEEKQAHARNAAAKEAGKAGNPTGTHPTSGLPGQGTGH